MADILQEISKNLHDGEDERVAALVRKALDQGVNPQRILSVGLLGGMDVVGKEFKAGDLFVPEVLASARAMHAGMNILQPLLSEADAASTGKFLIGTVKEDLHDIGKNLVKMLMEGAEFKAIDLGIDVPPDKFVAAVREHKPDIVAMSALLTTTMLNMKATVEALDKAGLRKSVKIMVGGAPVTSAFAKQIGADGYAPDAASAVDIARKLIGK